MVWAADRIGSAVLRVGFSALFLTGIINACFAQSEPPLTVPSVGRLPGPGCEGGLGGNGLYGNAGPVANASSSGNTGPGGNPGLGTGPTGNSGLGGNIGLGGITNPSGNAGAGGNTSSDVNVPLYSDKNLYGNFPLYSNPDSGNNIPLYTNSDFYRNSRFDSDTRFGSSAQGGYAGVGGGIPTSCHSGIPVGGWLLYPSVRLYSAYSDNLFLSPTSPVIKALGFGASPSLTAQWTNGIHTTTIYANFDTEAYPTDSTIDTFNREATVTQKYAPLPDLTFTVLGDYTHQTISSSLTNSIPNAISTPPSTPTRLANGNIELPNGQIVSPSGQIVGQANPVLANSGTSLVNPFDQFTGTATVSKIFNRGILTLSGSLASTDYQSTQGTGPTSFTSFATKTFTEKGAYWLGPVLYAYSDGTFSMRANNEGANANSDAYRVIGGIGTRQFGEFRSSLYFGYQGSEVQDSGTAGGEVYGGKISYYPTPAWTITAAIDETINVSSQTAVSTQALTLPVNTPVQVPLGASTRNTNTSLQAQYSISPLWQLHGTFGYTRTAYINSAQLNNAWLADVVLSYDIWRNMTLTWEYQYTSAVSNVPFTNATRNLFTMSANYRF